MRRCASCGRRCWRASGSRARKADRDRPATRFAPASLCASFPRMTDELLFEVADGIGRVTFNRPAQRNALTWAMYDGLVAAVERANADNSIGALVLTGAGGKAFAAGTDIGQFRAFNSPADAIGYEERIDTVLSALEACRVPTIA